MKTFEDIGKKLPYTESDEYLDNLVDQCTENAIRQKQTKPKATYKHLYVIAAAALLVFLLSVTITHFKNNDRQLLADQQVTSPIDQFLDGLSDDEVLALNLYDMEEIPEY
ncbi:hypothetical protein [Prevotella sp. Rep29]|uniref:hypothetical protein n=1 Tax=Prevotella sp. Rep29 TaxID=2691580 RepID=UPI001C6EDE2C|nr:hypothetical protein [Prevotella sp. Rep29]QYR09829.1 hypothetical protein GRF55_01270 [Prevotella sp. Rep29]